MHDAETSTNEILNHSLCEALVDVQVKNEEQNEGHGLKESSLFDDKIKKYND